MEQRKSKTKRKVKPLKSGEIVPGKLEEQPPEAPLPPLPCPPGFNLDSSEALLLNPYNSQRKNKILRANKYKRKIIQKYKHIYTH